MLTQPTERDKVGVTVRLWAPVYLVLVDRALQVLVEPGEIIKRPVAKEALVREPVPRAFRRPRHRGRGRLGAAERAGEQTRRVRDVVVRVGANDELVELCARHAGRAGARLEVERERGMQDEGPVAAAAGAAYVGRSMQLRVEVLEEVALALEELHAVCAVGVHVAIVFLELCVGIEWLYHAGPLRVSAGPKESGIYAEAKKVYHGPFCRACMRGDRRPVCGAI